MYGPSIVAHWKAQQYLYLMVHVNNHLIELNPQKGCPWVVPGLGKANFFNRPGPTSTKSFCLKQPSTFHVVFLLNKTINLWCTFILTIKLMFRSYELFHCIPHHLFWEAFSEADGGGLGRLDWSAQPKSNCIDRKRLLKSFLKASLATGLIWF